MSSQEEYLDKLLKDAMNGVQSSEQETSDGVHVNYSNELPDEFEGTASESPAVSDTVIENAPVLEDPVFSSPTASAAILEEPELSMDAFEAMAVIEEQAFASAPESAAILEEPELSMDAFAPTPDIEEQAFASAPESEAILEEPELSMDAFEAIPDIEEPAFDSAPESVDITEEPELSMDAFEPNLDIEEPAFASAPESEAILEEPELSMDAFEATPVIEEPAFASAPESAAILEEPELSMDAFEAMPVIEEPAFASTSESVDIPEEKTANKDRYDVQDTANMSPEDIERILAESAGTAAEEEKVDRSSVDLETLLEEADETNLKDINDMLLKADRNEPVDEGIIELLEQAQQQSGEMDWKDIEEQGNPSQPKEEKGLRKFFSKLFGWKKGNKTEEDVQETEQPENRRQDGTGVIENISKRNARKKAPKEVIAQRETGTAPVGPESASESEKTANAEMDELFGAMEAFGAGQKTAEEEKAPKQQDSHKAEENAQNPAKEADGIGADSFAESEWTELQGLTLGKSEGKMSGNQEKAKEEAQVSQQNNGTEAVLGGMTNTEISDDEIFGLLGDEGFTILPKKPEKAEETVPENDSGEFGVPDTLDILGDMGAPEGEGEQESDKKNGKEKKAKKEKASSDKKGVLARLMDFLTQEDAEVEEEQQLILSDENDAILRELNEENSKKKSKKKKGKKAKNAQGEADETDSEDNEESGEKKNKKKKEKPKKVREPKQSEPEAPGKRLSKRRVSLIFLICGTIGAAILILGNIMTDYSDKKKAVAAFYEGDYETCYQNLIGKQLNESQQIMYGKSESILRMRLWMREYEMFVQAGQEPEALDSLIQSVHDYPALYLFSIQWNAGSEVRAIYSQMLLILESKYGLTEENAEEIANERDDLIYSQKVRAIAGGGSADWGGQPENPPEEERDSLKDLLPEEEELGDTVFAD